MRSNQEVQALLDSAKAEIFQELSARVAAANAVEADAREDLEKDWYARVRSYVVDYLKEHRLEDHEGAIDTVSRLLAKALKHPTTASIAAAVTQAAVKPKQFSEEELRQELEAQLKEEGASSTLIAKFQFMSLAELQTKLQNMRDIVRWKTLGHDDLQAEAQGERQVLPGITPIAPGTPILSPNISRRALTQYRADELRKLKRAMDQRHGIGSGDAAVSARLSGADANEIKRIYGV